jgi:hypothetical protein
MKMIKTPTAAAITGYTGYIHNCLRNAKCEPSWLAPLPGVPYLQLYVDYGTTKPVTVEFQLRDVCADTTEQIFPSNYTVGQTPEGNWYGVFKYFNTPMAEVTSFVVWHSALVQVGLTLVEKTYFSEMMVVEPCAPLTKVKSCHPEGSTDTGFDVNGIYYGLPVNLDYLGLAGIRYFHIAYVRLGKVRELSNKATFKSSLVANFRTTIEKIHQLETELVPQWFKDVLLAIYSRGAIQVNDGPAMLVSDLAIEPINDDDVTWKPFAQLKQTFRLYFGCDASECIECCSPEVLSASVVSESAPSESEESASGSVEPTPEQFLGVIQSNSGGGGNVITAVKFNGVDVTHVGGDNFNIGFNDTGTFKTPSVLPGTYNVTVTVGIGFSPPVGGVTVTGSNGVQQNQATPVSGNYIFPLVQIDDTDLWLVQMGTFL